MTERTCHEIYQSALLHRKNEHPFGGSSAYKVRESQRNLEGAVAVLRSVQAYLAASPSMKRSVTLVSCTRDDMARKIKLMPQNLAEELGYNLVPAVLALGIEGLAASAIDSFAAELQPIIHACLANCEVARLFCKQPASVLYSDLRSPASLLTAVCDEALTIADAAVALCNRHGI